MKRSLIPKAKEVNDGVNKSGIGNLVLNSWPVVDLLPSTRFQDFNLIITLLNNFPSFQNLVFRRKALSQLSKNTTLIYFSVTFHMFNDQKFSKLKSYAFLPNVQVC